MLLRKATQALENWKAHKGDQGLLVVGARQVGKTTTIEEFAHNNYEVVAKIDFIETPRAKDVIKQANNAEDLFMRLTALSNVQLVPHKTLVFFDEIQEYEDILTWAKYLQAHAEFDYIFSGSLIGVNLAGIRSFPVGFLDQIDMFPLDFEEFCWANDIPTNMLETVKESIEELREVPDFIHSRMLDLHRQYLMVGGMPQAVQRFVDTHDVVATRKAQEGIVKMYEYDISKHMEDNQSARFIKHIYEGIPSQLNKENKRFKFRNLAGAHEIHEGDLRFSRMESSFDWLESAGVAILTQRISQPEVPLGLYANRNVFKVYMNDVGLLTYRLGGFTDLEILSGDSNINYGSIYENFAAQELRTKQEQLFYYNNSKRGEVDFVVQDISEGSVSLIEIKSGKDYKRHVALKNLLSVKDYRVKRAMVFSQRNVEVDGRIVYLPIYMIGML